MFDSVYKLRYQKKQRRLWNAAAALREKDLSEWMRDALDQMASADLLSPPQK